MTAGALVVGLVLVILLVVRPGSSSGQPSDSGNPYGLIKPDVTFPANLANGRSIGKADAPVTLEVWADFQCPFCGQLARTVESEIVTNLVTKGTVRIVARDFSFLGAGHDPDESMAAAIAARCADRQGKFWDYYEMLFWNQGTTENSGAFAQSRLVAMADLLGLDEAAFVSCLDDPGIVTEVTTETAAGRAAKVTSTPTTFINGTPVIGVKDYATMASLIGAAAAKASPAAGAPSGSASSSPGASASP